MVGGAGLTMIGALYLLSQMGHTMLIIGSFGILFIYGMYKYPEGTTRWITGLFIAISKAISKAIEETFDLISRAFRGRGI